MSGAFRLVESLPRLPPFLVLRGALARQAAGQVVVKRLNAQARLLFDLEVIWKFTKRSTHKNKLASHTLPSPPPSSIFHPALAHPTSRPS